jgi:hypothetical protein
MSDSPLVTDREQPGAPASDVPRSVIGDAVIAAAPCTTGEAPTSYTPAEQFMRRLLFIREPDPDVPDDQVNKLFETSILISAIRCTLAYVVFPIFAPALYAASDWGPAIGLTVGAVALVFDVAGMRRFWKADHRWRWPMTGIYACVMVLVVILVVHDIGYLVS